MATLNEIITNWQTPAGGGFVAVMYFEDGVAPINDQRQAVHTLWESIEGELVNEVLYFQDQAGRQVDETTGTLVGQWTDSEAFGGAGTSSGEAVADATQALIRWRTEAVVGGRFLQGRTFVPGLAVENLVNGNLSAASQSTFNGALATFIAGADGFGIWHRPVLGAGGVHHEATTGSMWSELAVLRRRRQ